MKKLFKKPIYLDYIDGRLNPKNVAQEHDKLLFQYMKRARVKDGSNPGRYIIDYSDSENYLSTKKDIFKEVIKYFKGAMATNPSFAVYTSPLGKLEDKPKYVISEELQKALGRTKLNVKSDSLPSDLHCYIEYPSLKSISGGIIKFVCAKIVQDYEGKRLLHISVTSEIEGHPLLYGYSLILERGKSMEECFQLTIEHEKKESFNGRYLGNDIKEGEVELNSKNSFRVILNTLIYVACSKDDFQKFIPKKPKMFNLKKKRTPRPRYELFYVGYNYSKVILQNSTECSVRGHFRWQPCGKGRKEVKLIYINPHSRILQTKVKAS